MVPRVILPHGASVKATEKTGTLTGHANGVASGRSLLAIGYDVDTASSRPVRKHQARFGGGKIHELLARKTPIE
jgi:hypothetical protein